MTTSYWNGTNSNDYYDQDNWSYDDLPQTQADQSADITGTNDNPALAIANAVSPDQIECLTVGNDGMLKITAQAGSDFAGNVFATQGFQIFQGGQLIIDTPSQVELGAVNEMSGTLTIMNNAGNVVLDGNRLSGDGTLNLVNSVLGSTQAPISIDESMNVTLQDNSVLYAGFYADGATVTFDPATANTLVLNGQESTINTAFVGVSEYSYFAINGASGVVPTSAHFARNANGTYSLTINEHGGKTLTLGNITLAAGFTPGRVRIGTDASGDYVLYERNVSSLDTSYLNNPTHQGLYQLAQNAQRAGGDLSQYSTTPYTQHNPTAMNDFIGTGTAEHPGEWSNANNWSLGYVPQQNGSAEASIAGTEDQPLHVVADQASIAQIAFLTVANNATFEITAAQTANPLSYVFTTQGFQIWNDGNFIINTSARVDLGSVNNIGGTLTIQNNDGNVVFDTAYINGTGTLNLVNSTLGSVDVPVKMNIDHISLSDNSVVYAAPFSAGTGSVTFDNSNNVYVLSGQESSIGTDFENVSSNTSFAINGDAGLTPVSSSWSLNDDGSYTLTINLDNGESLKLTDVHTAQGFHPGISTWTQDEHQNWMMHTASGDVCFLEGTLIRTDRGDVAIEDLRAGDMLAVQDAQDAYRAVIWTGARDVRVKIAAPDAEAGYPVRIVAGALGENLPQRDLLVTPEHCLLLDGAFVPVRMLVNGASVFYDRSITAYRYVHVETAQHSVIFAENVATESYLDTGNRRNFTAGPVVSLHGAPRDWQQAAAPLNTDRAFVEPLAAGIAARAEALGLSAPSGVETTSDPALRLLDQHGRSLRLLRTRGTTAMFALPADVRSVRIASRASRPADAIGPFVDDRRSLGVLVGQVTVWDADATRAVTSHLTDADAFGWHAIDNATIRWTDGHARLDLGARMPGANAVLSIEIVSAGPYVLEARTAVRLSA